LESPVFVDQQTDNATPLNPGLAPHGYQNWVHSEEIVYFLNGSVWIKVLCGMFSTDHWRKISPSLKMGLTLISG